VLPELRQRGIITKTRTLKSGKIVGGIPFTRGSLAHLLRNRFYVGEVMFKGEVLPGEQPAILDRALFEAVQAKLTDQANSRAAARSVSEALLLGRIFDDRGNRMTPSHARRRGIKYGYYLSSALLQGQSDRSGSVPRLPAAEVEAVVLKAVREHLGSAAAEGDRLLIERSVVRVEVQPERLVIELAPPPDSDGEQLTPAMLYVAWHKPPTKRRRELLLPAGVAAEHARSIRAETRATLVAAIARGRRWLAELLDDRGITAERIAARESCSIRKVQMMISLAFLSPELVKAAIEGRLPRGIGIARLAGMPAQWSRQHQMLGLTD